jgi:hypothetical protein
MRSLIPILLSLVCAASALAGEPSPYSIGTHLPVVYENQGAITIPIQRTGPLTDTPVLSVDLFSYRGSMHRSQSVQFAAGADTVTAIFPISDDQFYGGGPVEWTISLRAENKTIDSSRVTTIDDEPEPHVVEQRVQVIESDGTQMIPITLTIEPAFLYGGHAYVKADDQTAGDRDFKPGFTYVYWAPKQTTTTLWLEIRGDDVAEEDETFRLTTPGYETRADVVVEIIDDDRPPFALAFESPDYTFDEVTGGIVKITRTGTLDATKATLLFLPLTPVIWPEPIEIAFAAGESSKLVALDVDDAWYTGKRDAMLTLEWEGFRGASTRLTLNDDESRPTLTIGDASVSEGAPGETKQAEFELTLSGPVGGNLVVGVATEHGTARGEDYVPLVTSAVVPVGSLSAKVAVQVRGDAAQEPDETFALHVTSCCGGLAELARNKAAAIIRNDDGGVSAAFALEAASQFEERSAWLQVIVTRTDGASDATATVKLNAGPARAVAPVNVRFRAGELRKTVRWYLDDHVHSGDAHATVEAYAGARRDDAREVKIIDDERAPTITLHDTTVPRIDGNPGPRLTSKFVLTIDPPVWTDMQMQIATYTQGSQYVGWANDREFEAINRLLTIPAGTSRMELPVWVQGLATNSQRNKGFLLRMTYFGPASVVATLPKTEARCEFVASLSSGATLGTYDRFVPVGGTQRVTVQLPSPVVIADAMKLVSSDPSVLTVPENVMVVPGSSEVTFEATGIARGAANVKITLPVFYQSEQLTAPLEVISVHVPSASPSYVLLRSGETVRVAVGAMPVSSLVIRGTVEAKDKSIVFVQPNLQVMAVGWIDVYGANAGKTELIVRFDDDAGATELRIPVEVTDADPRTRGVRH